MPFDPVEQTKQIKAASDIVAVVGTYLALKPAGKTFKALCPFHPDSRPSLDVDPQRQRYKCWSCGAQGDVFAFVMHMEKVGFKEARAILAQRAGIKLDEQPSPHERHRSQLLEVMKWAQAKYAYQLLEEEAGEAARQYLGERRLAGKTIRQFGLGYAPLQGDWLARLAAADGIADELLVEVGLIAPSQSGRGYYDRFRDRVMFPIRDVRGQVVGFGGRILPTSPLAARGPKYYNSAETPLFHKSELLYGLDLARHAGAAAGYLAVVEGYTDVMMAHQCGIAQVVATMGTALNAKHVAQLRRYVPKVVLVYDADAGGFLGVDRALELFIAHDVELAVATLPDELDPCDLLVRPDGVATFQRILNSASDALDFKLNRLLEKTATPSDQQQRRILDEILSLLAAAPPQPGAAAQVKRELIINRLAHRLGLRQETVWARFGELRKAHETTLREQAAPAASGQSQPQNARATSGFVESAGDAPWPTTERPRTAAKVSAQVAAERQLVELLLGDPALVAVAAPQISPAEITHTGLRRILTELYAIHHAGLVPDLEHLRVRLEDRPDLFEAAAYKLQPVGQLMQDRDEWLTRLLKRFAEWKATAAVRSVKQQLATADDDQAAELFRQLQRAQPPKRSA
ncbi:MAG: DNA primase [Gemmataceae bacterium]|nr:DNA primase [Gemmata sp.]MDW8197131.1 DNA primase [Gemmataceae bacterium]